MQQTTFYNEYTQNYQTQNARIEELYTNTNDLRTYVTTRFDEMQAQMHGYYQPNPPSNPDNMDEWWWCLTMFLLHFIFFFRMNNFISLFLMTSFIFDMVVRIILMLSFLDNIHFGFVWLGMLDNFVCMDNHVMFMHLLHCFVYFVPYLDMLLD